MKISDKDDLLYISNVSEFMMISSLIPNLETGITVNGEVKIDDKTSVVTEKEIPLENPEKTVTSYLKVMEMRELTPEEREDTKRIKYKLRRIFEIVFKGKKWFVLYTAFLSLAGVIDIASENYFNLFFKLAVILVLMGPVRLLKEVKKILTAAKRKEEVAEYLKNNNLYGIYNTVDDPSDIQMYIRKKV